MSKSQILIVNNSAMLFGSGDWSSLGVLHQATIPHAFPDEARVINSTMLVVYDDASDELVSEDAQRAFVESDTIAGADAYR